MKRKIQIFDACYCATILYNSMLKVLPTFRGLKKELSVTKRTFFYAAIFFLVFI